MIRIENVVRHFGAVHAVRGIDLTIEDRDFVAITGPSGCGKSTLLHLLGGMDQPTSGRIFIDELPLHEAGERELTAYRRKRLGIVFQFFNLLPTMTLAENVELPLLLGGSGPAIARQKSHDMLDVVGLSHRLSHFPHQVSGGEMQRTAIARALVHEPALLLADEPTGNLDTANAGLVLETFGKIASQQRTTLIVVTHSLEVASLARRRIRLLDGLVESDQCS